MKPASIAEIKKELSGLDAARLSELTLRLARYKKENKEMLTYLLFEAGDERAYVSGIKREMEEQFEMLVKEKNLYFLKKSIRRILRLANKQIKYSGIKESEIDVRIHFCAQLKNSGIRFEKSPVLLNMYQMQVKKIHTALSGLPEDLQYDYHQALSEISL